MTDAGRGLFDETPPAGDEAGADAPAGGDPSRTPPGAPADPARVAPDEVHARSRAAAIPDDAALVDAPHAAAPPRVDDEGRPVALRLAGLHVRMGSLALARAELESLAGRGMLDEPALLDLAEVRWRTGDLAGAGEAANALLARDREDPLALVIAAESVSALGRPGGSPVGGPRARGHRRPAGPAVRRDPAEPRLAGRSGPGGRSAARRCRGAAGAAADRSRHPRAANAVPAARLDRGGRGVRRRAGGARRGRHGTGSRAPGRRPAPRARLRTRRPRRDREPGERPRAHPRGRRRAPAARARVGGPGGVRVARGHVHSPAEPHVREAAAAGDTPIEPDDPKA